MQEGYILQNQRGELVANITVLNEATNRNKLRAKAPQQYIADFGIDDDALKRHIILFPDFLDVESYDDFVMSRAEMLADASNAFFERLTTP